MYHELAIDARGPAVVSGLFSVCAERCRGTLSEGLRITSWRTLCDGDSPERGVFFDRYRSSRKYFPVGDGVVNGGILGSLVLGFCGERWAIPFRFRSPPKAPMGVL